MPSLINAAPSLFEPGSGDALGGSFLNGTPLAAPPTRADAFDANSKAYADWLAAQKADGIAKGLIDPQTGWPTKAGLEDAANQLAQSIMLGTTSSGEGTLMHRFTNGPVDRGVGFMMYADEAEKAAHYGKNHYVMDLSKIDPAHVVDAESPAFQAKIVAALEDAPHLTESYQATPEDLASQAAPENIVNSAGLWDAPDLASHVWDNVLEPHGYTVVKTPDGAISFDPAHAELQPVNVHR